MWTHKPATLPFLDKPVADGERKRYADNEEEERKDHVDVGHAVYISGKMVGPPGKVFDSGEVVHEDHDQDGQAAKDIDRGYPGGSRRRRHAFSVPSPGAKHPSFAVAMESFLPACGLTPGRRAKPRLMLLRSAWSAVSLR